MGLGSLGLFLESVLPLMHLGLLRPLPGAEDSAGRCLSMYCGSAISGIARRFSVVRQLFSILRQYFLDHKFRRLGLRKFAGIVLASGN